MDRSFFGHHSAISAGKGLSFARILGLPSVRLTLLVGLNAVTPFAQAAEVKVRLFGQDCQMSGAFSAAQLNAIHSVGPEQMPAPARLDQAQKQLEKISKTKGLPPAFSEYRERLEKRLKLQVQFFSLWNEARKKGAADSLLPGLKNELSESRQSEIQKLLQAKEWRSNQDAVAEIYFSSIEEYPDELFFRTLTRQKIQYQCSFDDGEHSHDHDSTE